MGCESKCQIRYQAFIPVVVDSENIVGYSVAYPPLLARSFPLVKFSDSVRSSFSSPDVVDLGERQRKRAKRTDGRTAEQCFHKGRNDVGRLHFQVAKVGKLGPDGNIFIVLHILSN